MPIEEQTQEDGQRRIYAGSWQRVGQKLTISGREVTKLSFILNREAGGISQDVLFTIRQVDGTLIVSKVWGWQSQLPLTPTWQEVEFDTPPTINEEVRIGVEFPHGSSIQIVALRRMLSDVKADEHLCEAPDGVYTERTAWDCAYKYTYEEAGGLTMSKTNWIQRLLGRFDRQLFSMDFWSDPVEEKVVTNAQVTAAVGAAVVVADLPAGATIVRAIVMMKFRIVENTNVAENSLDLTAVQPIQVDDVANTGWLTAIDFIDEQFKIAAETREGGDVLIGDNDVAARVDGNDTYDFQWLNAKAHLANIQFNDIQMGIRIWYSI